MLPITFCDKFHKGFIYNMLDISGHLRPIRRDLGFENNEKNYEINCCGYQYIDDTDFIRNRPLGRLDFQIIYLHHGRAVVKTAAGKNEIKAGTIIVYYPHEPQYYKYYSADIAEDYWIHFTGAEALYLMRKYALNPGIYTIGVRNRLCSVFKEIMVELQLKNDGFEEIVNNLFQTLPPLIRRYIANSQGDLDLDKRFETLILLLNDSYQKNWTVKEMAGVCHLSSSRFIHYFKERKGIAPLHFLIELRIAKAKEMMLNSSLNVTQVARLIGYNDPLYFSRIFKKVTGISPRSFLHING